MAMGDLQQSSTSHIGLLYNPPSYIHHLREIVNMVNTSQHSATRILYYTSDCLILSVTTDASGDLELLATILVEWFDHY